jgi:hypothetical protein
MLGRVVCTQKYLTLHSAEIIVLTLEGSSSSLWICRVKKVNETTLHCYTNQHATLLALALQIANSKAHLRLKAFEVGPLIDTSDIFPLLSLKTHQSRSCMPLDLQWPFCLLHHLMLWLIVAANKAEP